MSFTNTEYARKRKQTRRERLLIETEQVVPKGLDGFDRAALSEGLAKYQAGTFKTGASFLARNDGIQHSSLRCGDVLMNDG